ncbi:MAG TPA: hypothetical protein VFG69_14380 [Nannocystaceae bacterium]|nr:hypothetical protein [Nannocystaceae bacterium]
MSSLIPLLVWLSSLLRLAAATLRTGVRRVETRLRSSWAWRNGRERAAMRGVIHC